MIFSPQRSNFLNQLNGSLCGTVFIALDTQINQNPATHSNVNLLTLNGGSSRYHLSWEAPSLCHSTSSLSPLRKMLISERHIVRNHINPRQIVRRRRNFLTPKTECYCSSLRWYISEPTTIGILPPYWSHLKKIPNWVSKRSTTA